MHDPFRPTFEHRVDGTAPDTLRERIAGALERPGGEVVHRRAGDHFLVWLPDDRRHMWSPWLHVDVHDVADAPEASMIFGRFTPAPSVWTAVMFSYLALGVVAIGSGLFAYCQSLVGEQPWALWAVLACFVLAILVLLISRAGQRLAREQMAELVAALEGVVTNVSGAGDVDGATKVDMGTAP